MGLFDNFSMPTTQANGPPQFGMGGGNAMDAAPNYMAILQQFLGVGQGSGATPTLQAPQPPRMIDPGPAAPPNGGAVGPVRMMDPGPVNAGNMQVAPALPAGYLDRMKPHLAVALQGGAAPNFLGGNGFVSR